MIVPVASQEKVRVTAPSGWQVDLADMSMGSQGPKLSNFQAMSDSTGEKESLNP